MPIQHIFFKIIILCFTFFKVNASMVTGFQNKPPLERILHYDVTIKVDTMGTLFIAEHIKVLAQGDKIKRGIFRTLPNNLIIARNNLQAQYVIDSVLHNNKPAKFTKRNLGGEVLIRIGNASEFIDKGEHTYSIFYTVNEQIRFFEDYSELYWNVTGNAWDFQIDSTTVKVSFPKQVAILENKCFTGFKGNKSSNCEIEKGEGVMLLFTAGKLYKNQGFTIASKLSNDFYRLEYKLINGDVFSITALVLFFGYFLLTWFFLGKHHKSNIIIPQFSPPKDISPAMARYLLKDKIDGRSFISSLVNLSIAKQIAISVDNNEVDITKNENNDSKQHFLEEEHILSQCDTKADKDLGLGRSFVRFLKDASFVYKSSILTRIKEQHFLKVKWPYIVVGFLISFAFINVIHRFGVNPYSFVDTIINSFAFYLISFLFYFVYKSSRGSVLIVKWSIRLFIVFCLLFIVLASQIPVKYMLFPLGIALVNMLYINYLKVISAKRQLVINELKGLERYLKIAEQQRFELLNPPHENLQLFEALYPYAIAFNIENTWMDRFKDLVDPNDMLLADISKLNTNIAVYRTIDRNAIKYGNIRSFRSSSSSGSTSRSAFSGGGNSGSSGGGSGGGGGGGW